MYKYKNKSHQDQIVPGIGEVKAGGEIQSQSPIENPNFEYLGQTETNSVVGTEAPQPGAVVQGEKLGEVNTGTEVK